MIYIEENFENTLLKKYSDKEVELLQVIIASLKENEMVEGIILTPFIKRDKKYKSPIEFNSDFIIFVDNSDCNIEEIETLIKNIKSQLNNCDSKVSDSEFNVCNINIFNERGINFYRMALESFLVSSYILYDKNENLTELQNKLCLKTRTITNNEQMLIKLDNVDALSCGITRTQKIS